jgi:hypothetical protein
MMGSLVSVEGEWSVEAPAGDPGGPGVPVGTGGVVDDSADGADGVEAGPVGASSR